MTLFLVLKKESCTAHRAKMKKVYSERVARIELAASAWKAEVLPLYDTRSEYTH